MPVEARPSALRVLLPEALSPAEGILAFAGRFDADLIGSSAVGAILLGSNARRAFRTGNVPVLALPPAARSTPGAFAAGPERCGPALRRAGRLLCLPSPVDSDTSCGRGRAGRR
jgi:hypothetical protein